MKRRLVRRSLWIIAILGIVGIALSVESYRELLKAQSGGETWCNFSEVSNCVKAFQSPYSKLWGRPISLYGGAVYFLVASIAFLGLFNGGPYLLASAFHLGLISFLLLGATGYFAWALFFQVKTLCVLCITDYLINLAVITTSWWTCWKLKLPYRSLFWWDLKGTLGTPANLFRTVLMVVLFIVFGVVLVHQERRYYLFQMGLTRAIDGTLDRIATPWAEAFPTTGPKEAPIRMVMFGDYSCPYCAMLKRDLSDIMKEYPNLIRLTAIPAPSNSDCSDLAPDNTSHPFACKEAYLSLAVLKKKGESDFWKIHDELYRVGPFLNDALLSELAHKYGLSDEEIEEVIRQSKSPKGLELQNRSARIVGVGVLPFLIVNGFKIRGYLEKWALLEVIKAELKRKGLRLQDFRRGSSAPGETG